MIKDIKEANFDKKLQGEIFILFTYRLNVPSPPPKKKAD